MNISFRWYQTDAIRDIIKLFCTRNRILYVAPAGAGKTLTALGIVQQLGVKTRFIVHRTDLKNQIQRAVHEAALDSLVTVSSVQSLTDAQGLSVVKLLIIDEVHHYINIWRELTQKLVGHDTLVLGMTATPVRSDRIDVAQLFDEVVVGPDQQTLEREGHLAKLSMITPTWKPIIWSIPIFSFCHIVGWTTCRDYELEDLGPVTKVWRKYVHDRPTLVFANSLKEVNQIVYQLNTIGVRAAAMHYRISNQDRVGRRRRFENGELQALVAVDLLSEGIDLPLAKVEIQMRRTESFVLWSQQITRVQRPYQGEKGLIVDVAGNAANFGLNPKPTFKCSVMWDSAGDELLKDHILELSKIAEEP